VMRKDLSVCREAGKASEFAELDDGDP
jgi:hypothetical protein